MADEAELVERFLSGVVAARVVLGASDEPADLAARSEKWKEQWSTWRSGWRQAGVQREQPTAAVTAKAVEIGRGVHHVQGLLSAEECDALIEHGWQAGTATSPPPTFGAAGRLTVTLPLPSSGEVVGACAATAREVVGRVEHRLARLLRLPSLKGLEGETGQMTQLTFSANEPDSMAGSPTIGLHVDQNNGNQHRWATLLVYLNTLSKEAGGDTRWPAALAPSHHTEAAAAALVNAGIMATTEACTIEINGDELTVGATDSTLDAAVLTAAAESGEGVTTKPVAGDAVLFFSVDPTDNRPGVPASTSWHCGTAAAEHKWTLQIFLSLPEYAQITSVARQAFLIAHVC